MNKRYTLYFAMLALLLLSACAGDITGRPSDPPGPAADSGAAEPASPGETEPAADPVTFEAMDLEGNAVSSEIFSQSKVTMVNVWATYCNPCLREMPDLGQLAADYEPEEFQLIGIVSDVMEGGDQSLAESLVEQTGADYPHLLLNESLYYALLTDVTAVPTTFFLDGEGTILEVVVGAREKSVWEEKIDGLLEER